MKYPYHSTDPQEGPTPQQIAAWSLILRQWQSRLAPFFARPEVLQHALLYLQAILSDIPAKMAGRSLNTPGRLGPMACNACSRAPSGTRMACAMRCAALSARPCLSLLRLPTSTPEESPFPVLVIDESGFPKRGRHSAGVGRQYCGISGRVENCQVGVFLSYVTALGHAPDRPRVVPARRLVR